MQAGLVAVRGIRPAAVNGPPDTQRIGQGDDQKSNSSPRKDSFFFRRG
jgi:hypothetical protein